MTGSPRWRKIPKKERIIAEEFLRVREASCVSACVRFLCMKKGRDHVWALPDAGGGVSCLLLHSRHSLYPVFPGGRDIPLPRFLRRFLGQVPIHAVQGLKDDVSILETAMENRGYLAAERIDYDLMTLDSRPNPACYRYGPPELVIRPPVASDSNELFFLQSAYEQEEVLPRGAIFNPAACRINLEHILASEKMLLASLGGQIVGKINTSGLSFTRFQIGGVYVRPDCRSLGIAVRMTAVFLKGLIDEGRGVTLFVKKHNAAARAVYRRIGFSVQGDYRISYF